MMGIRQAAKISLRSRPGGSCESQLRTPGLSALGHKRTFSRRGPAPRCDNTMCQIPTAALGLRAVFALRGEIFAKAGRISTGLTLYGLRHTVAVILRELGYDDRAIANALGQKDPA